MVDFILLFILSAIWFMAGRFSMQRHVDSAWGKYTDVVQGLYDWAEFVDEGIYEIELLNDQSDEISDWMERGKVKTKGYQRYKG